MTTVSSCPILLVKNFQRIVFFWTTDWTNNNEQSSLFGTKPISKELPITSKAASCYFGQVVWYWIKRDVLGLNISAPARPTELSRKLPSGVILPAPVLPCTHKTGSWDNFMILQFKVIKKTNSFSRVTNGLLIITSVIRYTGTHSKYGFSNSTICMEKGEMFRKFGDKKVQFFFILQLTYLM